MCKLRFKLSLINILRPSMNFQRCDNEEALSYISSFRLGPTTLQNSDSAMRIRGIHLRLDVTGTYLQHDVGRTPAHMRTSLSGG